MVSPVLFGCRASYVKHPLAVAHMKEGYVLWCLPPVLGCPDFAINPQAYLFGGPRLSGPLRHVGSFIMLDRSSSFVGRDKHARPTRAQ